MNIRAVAINKSESYVEFVLCTHGEYSRPMAIISDYEAYSMTLSFLEAIPTHKVEEILKQAELELLRRKSAD